jgi:hypothetical protein
MLVLVGVVIREKIDIFEGNSVLGAAVKFK